MTVTLDDGWHVIDAFYRQKNALITHHIESYNQFIYNLPAIIQQENPITLTTESKIDNIITKYKHTINFTNVYLHKPYSHEIDGSKIPILPNQCRLRNLTYQSNLYVDVKHVIEKLNKNEKVEQSYIYESKNVKIGAIPIMLRSDMCVLNDYSSDQYRFLKEDMYDPGGYFIVNGSEKVIVSQERMNENHVYLFKNKAKNWKYPFTCEIKSKMEDKFSNPITTLIKWEKTGQIYIVVKPGWPKKDIPIFIFFRALGVENDEDIIKYIVYDMNDKKILQELKPSIDYENALKDNPKYKDLKIRSQRDALLHMASEMVPSYLNKFTDDEKIKYVLSKFRTHLLPHIGDDLIKKKFFVGYMVNKLLKGKTNQISVDLRDNYGNKRVDVSGVIMARLVKTLHHAQVEAMKMNLSKEFGTKQFKQHEMKNMMQRIIKSALIESKVKKSLSTGDFDPKGLNRWAKGVSQTMTRRSLCDVISYLRRIVTPIGKEIKGMLDTRRLQSTHWGMLCPAETPEGQSIGFTKNLALITRISKMSSSEPIITFLREHDIKELEHLDPTSIKYYTKLLVNGNWIGCVKKPYDIVSKFKKARRVSIINPEVSIVNDTLNNEIRIYSDGGRCIRPLYIVENNKLLITKSHIRKLKNYELSWEDLIKNKDGGVIEYQDVLETEASSLICMSPEDLNKKRKDNIIYEYSHCEIHPATILGICASTIPFCDHNQAPRNIFQSAMVKQAISVPTINFRNRMDTSMNILHYPQKPLVSTKSMKYFHYDKVPAGQNAIVAIMCYTGYNQEDSILMSQSAIDRGLYATTLYKTYKEELKKIGGELFKKPDPSETHKMKRHGSYEFLNDNGMVTPGSKLKHNDIIIGKVNRIDKSSREDSNKCYVDNSIVLKDSEATVDQVVLAKNDSGLDSCKVKVRMDRTPQIGDKFSSRHGQKGTIGITYTQEDMPFTKDGIIPDIIINPHAIPSRMTIGQLIECVLGKISSLTGEEQDATPFSNTDINKIPDLLYAEGFEDKGNEVLYNGLTGEQIQVRIFIGPTFYQRLKHMVKDKVHSRASGPIQMLTRQPAEGRARDGGLRLGEMERDCILAHGASQFLKERTMECSDLFEVFVCDNCGLIATANPELNLYECNLEMCKGINNISRIQIPYACKLFLQEIMSMNIYPKIITKNIDNEI